MVQIFSGEVANLGELRQTHQIYCGNRRYFISIFNNAQQEELNLLDIDTTKTIECIAILSLCLLIIFSEMLDIHLI